MLPLEAKATISGDFTSNLLKVADLQEIASGTHPFERMALDLRAFPANAISADLLNLPWAAFLTGEPIASTPSRPTITLKGDSRIARAGDVIEVDTARQKIAVRYRRGDKGNVLFATERCNSFCLMCSQPPRQIDDAWRVAHLCELIELIDQSEPSLAISGGEPTLLGIGLRLIIEKCAQALPKTQLHILSNGRLLGDQVPASLFGGFSASVSWGIPLYGDHYALHDYIVQSEGAFSQTIRGLYALAASQQRIEIRIVLVRPVVERLDEVVRFILRNLPFVEHVALMGIEPIGFAKAHHAELWVDPVDYAMQLRTSVKALTRSGVAASLYNLPLCVLPPDLWPYAKQSISDWKNDYLDACTSCRVKQQCGGFFSWITPQWTSRAISPIKEEHLCPTH